MLILLVEDEPLIELLAEEVLCDAGHEVLAARTGLAAVAVFRNARPRPDALIVDNRLPDMLGWDVAEICRGIAPSVPIVMCSADLWTGARDLTPIVCVEKPFTEDQLLDALTKAVTRA